MFKRSVILGGLIAGAFLLPAVAGAGKVSGVCSNCHTMHNSQNGVTVNSSGVPNDTLLTGNGCVGCHAAAGVSNTALGRGDDATIHAPQVDNNGTTGYINNAGYFNAAAADGNQHNVKYISSADAVMIAAGATNAPGDTAPLIGLGSGANPNLECSSCHGSSGGHHGNSSTTYRLLSGTNATTSAQTDFGAKAAVAGVSSGTRGEVSYNATDMNLFCANCHGLFHGAANQDGTALNDGTWIRHPTDVSMATQKALGATLTPSLQEGNNWLAAVAAQGTVAGVAAVDAVVVGSNGTATDVVMCLSCHVAHGGPYGDLLSYPYDASNNVAGGATPARSIGCETCHSYGAAAGTGM